MRSSGTVVLFLQVLAFTKQLNILKSNSFGPPYSAVPEYIKIPLHHPHPGGWCVRACVRVCVCLPIPHDRMTHTA